MAKQRPGDGGGWWWNDRPRASAVRRSTKAWGLVAIVALLAALAVACGGGGEPQAEQSPTPSPTGGEESPTPSPTGEDAALAPCRALEALKSYRYSVDLTLQSPELAETPGEPQPTPTTTLMPRYTTAVRFDYHIDGAFVAPDRTEALITPGGGDAFTMMVIGDQVWIELAGTLTPTQQKGDIPYRPLDICEAVLFDLDRSQVVPEEEKVSGVKSLHYTFPQASSPAAMAKIFGQGSDMDILIKTLDVELWLEEKDGYLLRLDLSGSGLYGDGRELRIHMSADIRDANSGDIRVEPPS